MNEFDNYEKPSAYGRAVLKIIAELLELRRQKRRHLQNIQEARANGAEKDLEREVLIADGKLSGLLSALEVDLSSPAATLPATVRHLLGEMGRMPRAQQHAEVRELLEGTLDQIGRERLERMLTTDNPQPAPSLN